MPRKPSSVNQISLNSASIHQRLAKTSINKLQQLFPNMDSIPYSDEAFPPDDPNKKQRDRIFTPTITFIAFLFQILNSASCRHAPQKIHLMVLSKAKNISSDTGGYCTARLRLSLTWLLNIFSHIAESLENQALPTHLWLGRKVRVIDCTTVKMPDTAQNQNNYPQPSTQKPGCGFPLVKIIAVFSLTTGAMLHFLTSAYTVHDIQLLKLILDSFLAGDILLADRAFSSFALIAMAKNKKLDVVLRLSSIRKTNFKDGKSLGKNDALFVWKKPLQRNKGISKKQHRELPDTLTVRILRFDILQKGFRSQSITLVTTLLDPDVYPKAELEKLFFSRWRIELSFRDLKTTLRMEMLRCLTPAMIEKEIAMHFIAYNLIRQIIWKSAAKFKVNIWRISFKGTLDVLRAAQDLFYHLKPGSRRSRQTFNNILSFIADDLIPFRPGRVEPRCIKRRPKPYQLLTKPRHIMKEIPHRGKRKYYLN